MNKFYVCAATIFFAMTCIAQVDTTIFAKQVVLTTLKDAALNEVSGIADCRGRKNCFWMHNDSGDSSRFFLVGYDGNLIRRILFNSPVLDCEDMSVGVGYTKGNYVYLGDIGDNYLLRPAIIMYIFKEDSLLLGTSKYITADKYRRVTLQYPDGPHDAEAFFVDSIDKTLYIVTKRDAQPGIYSVSLKQLFTTTSAVLVKHGVITHRYLTAGDVTTNSQEILLKGYDSVFYWKRTPGKKFYSIIKQTPKVIPYKREKQGEAICFAADGSGFYTTSEGTFQPIYFFKRK